MQSKILFLEWKCHEQNLHHTYFEFEIKFIDILIKLYFQIIVYAI